MPSPTRNGNYMLRIRNRSLAGIQYRDTILAFTALFALIISITSFYSSSQGVNIMDNLQVTVSPVLPEVLSGESLQVEVTVTNTGDEPVSVQEVAIPHSPVVYELRSPDDERVIYAVSQQSYRTRRSGGDVLMPMEPVMTTLETGQSVTLSEDLAEYAASGYAPGIYNLVARYQIGGSYVVSKPVEIRIATPNISNLSSLFCILQGNVCCVFDHTNYDGSASIFQRDITADILHRRLNIPAPGKIDDLMASAYAAPLGEGQWFAWLQDGTIGAGKGWGTVLNARVDPVPLELSSAKLISPGFQLADGSGLFLVSGLSDGNPCIQQFVFSADGAQDGKIFPLNEYYDDRVLACYDPSGKGSRMYLAWSKEAISTIGIHLCQYSVDSQTVTVPPELLYERRPPLAAFEMQTLAKEGKTNVYALFGPEGGDGEMNYVQIQIDDRKQSIRKRTFPAPSAEVKAWAISSADVDNPPVIAKTADSILWAQVRRDAEWNVLAEAPEEITHLQILASDRGGFWASWVDPSFGIRYAQILAGE